MATDPPDQDENLALSIAAKFHDAICNDDTCTPTHYSELLPPAREAAAQIRQAREDGHREAAEAIERYRDERPHRDRLGRLREAMRGYEDMRGWLTLAADIARGAQQPDGKGPGEDPARR